MPLEVVSPPEPPPQAASRTVRLVHNMARDGLDVKIVMFIIESSLTQLVNRTLLTHGNQLSSFILGKNSRLKYR